MECGPVFDVIPTLLADGYTIDLRIIASVTEFLGYDTQTNSILTVPRPRPTVPTVLPRFVVRQTKTRLQLRDGQTAVLGGLISSQVMTTKETELVSSGSPSEEPPFREQTIRTYQKKQLLVLITATLVDAAGNRIHSDDEMLIAHPGILPQNSR